MRGSDRGDLQPFALPCTHGWHCASGLKTVVDFRSSRGLRTMDPYDSEYEIEDEAHDDSLTADEHDLSRIACSFCINIIKYAVKFRALDEENFISDIPQFHKELQDNRGDLAERAKTCKVCAMVLSAINDPYRRRNRVQLEAANENDPHKCEVWWEFARLRSSHERPMLAITDEWNGTVTFKFRETLGLFLKSFQEAGSESMKQTEFVSYEVLGKWYGNCLNHGGTLQDLFLINDMESTTIRLIDVKENRLCDIPTREPYIALSYVWGVSSGDGDKLTTRNLKQLYVHQGITDHVSLPRTVRDAIEVTKGLKFRYLFVDRLCIIQDDNTDKAIYVEAMHEIYNKAHVTIVAAAGTDAQAGLPGTRGTPRSSPRLYHPRQFVNIDDGRDLVRVHQDELPPLDLLQDHLSKSTWATRGWTYQEEKLSERMLIFTDQAVFWKCSHICLYEDCPHDPHEYLSKGLVDMEATDTFGRDALWWGRKKKTPVIINNQSTSLAALTGKDSAEMTQKWYSKKRDMWISIVFRLRVQEFCARNITFQNDIARAFNGMIGAFKIVYEGLPLHHGMLTRSLPSELTWACDACVNNSHTTQKEHLGRRISADSLGLPLFPTWSWQGWQDPPTWFYGMRRSQQSVKVMDEEKAMTTSIYAGISHPSCTELVYQSTLR